MIEMSVISSFINILKDVYDLKIFENAEANDTWLNENLSEIQKQYKGKFISIYNSQIIEFDSDLDNLLKKIERLKIPIDLIKIDYIQPKKFACLL